MPPNKKQDKILTEEQTKAEGAKVGLSQLDLSTEMSSTNVPDEEPLWFKKAMVSFMQQVSEVIDKKFTSLDAQITEYISSLETRLETLESNNGKVNSEISELKAKLCEKDAAIQKLESNLNDLQNRQMRKMLVFCGFPEGAEGADTWNNCKDLIQNFVSNLNIDLSSDIIPNERAHRGRFRAGNKSKPRNVFVEFLRWGDADKILSSAQTAQKDAPYSFNGKKVMIFVDQMTTKRTQDARSTCMRVRKYLKVKEHPDWKMFVKFPAKLMFKSSSMKSYKPIEITDELQGKADAYANS